MAGPGRVTISSQASGFKWNANNRLLASAFSGENKENNENRSQGMLEEQFSNNLGVININNLVLNARAQQTFSEYGTSVNREKRNDEERPPKPVSGHFGMRSVGAGGFPRTRQLN